ncbi:MAG TPA: hypothetical protein VH041_09300 [Caldimonas sp.]|nr:hypothetical protein [Caldimonas sp.]HEX4234493.1 hypothetical protein [Caldimonas sp.]
MPRPSVLLGQLAALAIGAAALAGCTAPALLLTATGVATDTSMTWEIVKHIHGQLTEDDATPCVMLNSVQRALNARCTYVPGSIRTADIEHSGLQGCSLTAATQDSRLWRALPELLEKGALSTSCARTPLQDLAEVDACPDFQAASPAVIEAFVQLAESDPRAVRHDVFRMFSCNRARAVGLDRVLVGWLDRGVLQPGTLSFSPLEALDPEMLVSQFGHELQIAGHSPKAALDNYDGALPSGFEEALRTANWAALEWWLFELPQLANLAPPSRNAQMSWVPLQRVLLRGYLADPAAQPEMVSFLLARGANPNQQLPFDPSRTVVTFARSIKSPSLAVLEVRTSPAAPTTTLASTLTADGAGGTRPQRDGARALRPSARFDPPSNASDPATR